MHSLKAKIIKENLTIALIELGATRVIDLLSDLCDKIYKDGGSEIENLEIRPEADAWHNDASELKILRDSHKLQT